MSTPNNGTVSVWDVGFFASLKQIKKMETKTYHFQKNIWLLRSRCKGPNKVKDLKSDSFMISSQPEATSNFIQQHAIAMPFEELGAKVA
jgi:hypothetical protein